MGFDGDLTKAAARASKPRPIPDVRSLTKRCLLLPALLVGPFGGTLAGCARMDPQEDALTTRVDALVDPLLAANELSGAIVLTRGGTVVYERGFGMANHAAGVAFTPNTPSDGASLAKTFTAAGAWWLAQEGRLELDAPATRYLPDFPHEQTTVRHLLSHSNGLPPYYEFFDPYFAPDEVRTTQALLRVVSEHAATPSFTPGSRFEYSNLGFDVVALVIEQVTGQSYEAFLTERFFSPLGMQNTFARPARFTDWPGVRTMGYAWRDTSWQIFDVFDMEAFLGASNLYVSASDLARWASANAAGTALPAAVFAAGRQRTVIDGSPSPITGLSWYCDDSGMRGYYTGSLNAFHSLVYWDRERNEAAVLVTNSTMPPWQAITLQRDLVDALAERSTHAHPPDAFTRFSRDTRSTTVGRYVADGIETVTVSQDSNGLKLRIGAGLEFGVFLVSDQVFYVPGPDYWLAFGGAPPTTLYLRSMFLDMVLHRTPETAPGTLPD